MKTRQRKPRTGSAREAIIAILKSNGGKMGRKELVAELRAHGYAGKANDTSLANMISLIARREPSIQVVSPGQFAIKTARSSTALTSNDTPAKNETTSELEQAAEELIVEKPDVALAMLRVENSQLRTGIKRLREACQVMFAIFTQDR